MFRSVPLTEALFDLTVRALALSAVGLVLLIAGFVTIGAAPALMEVGGPRFFTDASWHPTEGSFGLGPMLAASLASSIGALALAVPIGVAIALFCRFYAGQRVSAGYRKALSMFAGVPSVVYGFWGLTVLVPLIAESRPPGASLLAGIVVLTLMILPTIALTSEAALSQVPAAYLRGGHALGLTQATVNLKIALFAARAGVLSGVVLALARALGETMALLMVSGNIVALPSSLFDPVRTLAANIALEMAYATGVHRSSLMVSGLMLIAIVLSLMLSSEVLTRKRHA